MNMSTKHNNETITLPAVRATTCPVRYNWTRTSTDSKASASGLVPEVLHHVTPRL